MKKYSKMYPVQDKNGMWIVVCICDGYKDITPWCFKEKSVADNYITSCGF